MGSLIVQHDAKLRGIVISDRVLIGRKAFNAVQIEHRKVSRLHAWVKPTPDGDMLIDSGSRNGTRLNGRRVDRPMVLRNGDHIEIGPALITYRADGWLPSKAEPIALQPTTNCDDDEGILFHCTCGAPLWVKRDLAGVRGKCRHCGTMMTAPMPATPVIPIPQTAVAVEPAARAMPEEVAPPSPIAPAPLVESSAIAPSAEPVATPPAPLAPPAAGQERATLCSICQCSLQPGEDITPCPACGHRYHAECWDENKGCAIYGCAQVGALEVRQEPSEAGFDPAAEGESAIPRDFLLLGLAVASVVVGVLTFGLPALIVIILTIRYLMTRPPGRSPRVAVIALVIAIFALLTGVSVSYLWWVGTPDWPLLQRFP